MRQNALLTVADNDSQKYFEECTYPNLRKYSDRVDADFIIYGADEEFEAWKKTKDPIYLFRWGINAKFKKLKELFQVYQRVLIIDSDFLVLNKAPNIFEVVPKDSMGLFNEYCWFDYKNPNAAKALEEQIHGPNRLYNHVLIKHGLKPFDNKNWNGEYYNNGFMVLSPEVDIFEEPFEYIQTKSHIQDYTNFLIRRSGVKVMTLSRQFDHFITMWKRDETLLNDAYFLHFAGIGGYSDYSNRCQYIKDYVKKLQELNLL